MFRSLCFSTAIGDVFISLYANTSTKQQKRIEKPNVKRQITNGCEKSIKVLQQYLTVYQITVSESSEWNEMLS